MKNAYGRTNRALSFAIASAFLMLAGCEGERVQSSLHPAGPAAESVANLWWILLAILGFYSVVTFALTLVAIFRGPAEEKQSKHEGQRFILIGGVILPAIILVPLLAYSLSTTQALRMRDSGLTIRVVGHRWWWEVQYPDHSIITANELYIPAGEPVRLELTSADIIHSFWVPQLQGKMDMIPGKVNEFWLEANRPGTYRGQCAEYCGLQHAHMAFEVRALPPDQFVNWIETHSSSSPATASPDLSNANLEQGKQLFFKHGCAVCHAIEGTPAQGRAGPDLTLFAIRGTLAAGTVLNTTDNLFTWVKNPQSIKPGANMPPTHTTSEELQQIVAYLESLGGKGMRP